MPLEYLLGQWDGSDCDCGICTPPVPNPFLNGLLWELPCTVPFGSTDCICPQSVENSGVFYGDHSQQYNITLIIRGVAEQKTYSGGTYPEPVTAPYFVKDATFDPSDPFNTYQLQIIAPDATVTNYYLNSGMSGQQEVFALDYMVTIPIYGGSTIKILADSVDGSQVNNDAELTVGGLPEIKVVQPYDGQFIQLDTF